MQNLQAAGESAGPTRFVYDGRLGELYVIFIKNVLLSIVTLGIYRFWGKTRIRRYLWSHTSLFGDRFEYTGTGKELFLGFLLAIGLLIVAGGGLALVGWLLSLLHHGLLLIVSLIFFVGLNLLFFVARFTALRYRLSRTRWRAIRGGLAGSPWRFSLISAGWNIANLVAAGFLGPVVLIQTLSYRLKNAHFGTARTDFDGAPGDLYPRFLAFFFGSIFLGLIVIGGVVAVLAGFGLFEDFERLGEAMARSREGDVPPELARLQLKIFVAIYAGIFVTAILMLPVFCWYYAFVYNYVLGKISIAGIRFAGVVRTWPMFGYIVVNLLILLLTLGLGFPWVLHRVMNFIVANVRVEGEIDAETVRQSQLAAPSTGEGLFELLDTGVI
ncbi:MAG: YjgN family protein [Reyranellaceae bacterium]